MISFFLSFCNTGVTLPRSVGIGACVRTCVGTLSFGYESVSGGKLLVGLVSIIVGKLQR